MSLRRALLAVGLSALPTGATWAQPTPAADPIADLLRQGPADPAEPDTAAAGPRIDPNPPPPPARPYVRPPAPTLSRPVQIEETGRSPDAPPSPADAAYDDRLKASAASARTFQGPMDGGWTLSGGGRDLYAFQLIDRGGVVEGAWRDLRRPGALDGSGFVDAISRADAAVTFRFSGGAVAVLRPQGGGWSGELTEGGRTEPVSLVRRRP